ncbi:DUF808 domain-containing protein [Luminiphilus syltensis]|uniref:DUF808 domain-containing protein n=1 Tax=Luminiphilus syltensis TaxID=1341119 RepID=UPI0003084C8F|nr:DUF808 domain-containing protein [Luminiphilus syltensis]
MAFGSLLALLDDIAAILDDVSVMTKVAAKKTAGVLGDDLAVNAEKVTGVRPERELAVVWAVFKGSVVNKCILVPAALVIATIAPWLITPLLVCGGLYLCFEGSEKLLHWLKESKHTDEEGAAQRVSKLRKSPSDLVALERSKIKGAIRTDFILSAEIIVLTLGVVEDSDLVTQLIVLGGIAAAMTVGVYGLVAAIVKLDDLGLYMSETADDKTLAGVQQAIGRGLLAFAPFLMKMLSIVGTVAMFMVGGGILLHAAPALEHQLVDLIKPLGLGGWSTLMMTLLSAIGGMIAGAILVAVFSIGARFLPMPKESRDSP